VVVVGLAVLVLYCKGQTVATVHDTTGIAVREQDVLPFLHNIPAFTAIPAQVVSFAVLIFVLFCEKRRKRRSLLRPQTIMLRHVNSNSKVGKQLAAAGFRNGLRVWGLGFAPCRTTAAVT
jgi:hypothetical protein